MFARLLGTLVGLMSCVACYGSPDLIRPVKREVVVYLKAAEAQPAETLEAMKREASAAMGPAGYHITWRNLSDGTANAVEASVVVVEFRGICQASRGTDAVPAAVTSPRSLASTAVADGTVLPFSWLECGSLSRLLAPELAKHEGDREFLFGRAMGRLLAHELFHVLANTVHHADAGIGKPRFSAKDVLSDRFQFEAGTIEQLRTEASGE